MAIDHVTAERVRELLDYNRESGVFRWKVGRRVAAGSTAGTVAHSGHIRIRVDGRKMMAHRLAWLYVYGVPPSADLDHINGVRDDNRITNLREASGNMNAQNQRRPHASNSASGLLGVHPSARCSSWVAQISVNGEKLYLGSFRTAEEAHQAYLTAKRRHHDGCTI